MPTITGSVTSGSFAQYYTFYIEYSVAQDIQANTSTLSVGTYMRKDVATQTAYGNNKSASQTVGGEAKSTIFSYDFRSGQPALKCIQSETYTVEHNADGTKNITISAAANFGTTLLGTASASATVALPTIPRASALTLSASGIDAGQGIRGSIAAASTAFSHEIVWAMGSYSATSSIAAGGTYADFTIPMDWLNAIPSAASGLASATLRTFSGGALIGTDAKTFTVNVPAAVVPTLESLDGTRVDGDVPPAWGVYLKGKSKITLELTGAAGAYGSQIASYSVSGGGFSSSAPSFTTGFLQTAGAVTFSGYVRDGRGRQSQTKTLEISVLDYANPVISSISTKRCDNAGVLGESGTYLKCTIAFSVSSCGGLNAGSATVKYRKTGASSWSAGVAITNNTPVVIGGTDPKPAVGDIDQACSYEVCYTVTDTFTSAVYTDSVSTAGRILNVRANGAGLALGKMSEQDGLEVAWDTVFKGEAEFQDDVSISGTVTAPGLVTVGSGQVNPNTLTTNTLIYSIPQANYPNGGNGHLLNAYLNGDGGYAMQLFMATGNAAGLYIRHKSAGTFGSWVKIWNEANDGAGSGLDADKTDGFHAQLLFSDSVYIPVVNSDGVMEIGKYIDFHYPSSTNDYDVRLQVNSGECYRNSYRMWDAGNAPGASASKYKENIAPYETDTDKLLQLQPKSFDWKEMLPYNGKHHIGIVAEDAAEIYPELVFYKDVLQEDGTIEKEIEGFNYQDMSVMLLAVCKKQQQQIEDLASRLSALESAQGA